jgi:hypothetical protein
MKMKSTIFHSIAVTALLLLTGCVSGTLLSTQSHSGLTPGQGTYNLILYGHQNARDVRSVAILDRTDDQYTILPFGATFNYRIIKNLSAAEARERGEQFLNEIYAYRATEQREIYGPDHTVIGYELRPLFMPFTTGLLGDVLDTSYVLQPENRVMVYVGYKGGHQDPLDSDGDSSSRDND